jgi:acyl carrier protein
MTKVSPEDVRIFLRNFLIEESRMQGRDLPTSLPDECDLLLSGFIDSLGLLELVTAIHEYFGSEIDFEALDPEHITVVEPLCRFVSEQLGES